MRAHQGTAFRVCLEGAYPGIDFCGKLLPLSYLYSMSVFLSLQFGNGNLGFKKETHRALCLYRTWYHSLSVANVLDRGMWNRGPSLLPVYQFSSSDLNLSALVPTFPPRLCSYSRAGRIRAS